MSRCFRDFGEATNYKASEDIQSSLSGMIYVGNLSFYTTEEQIYELFSQAGGIRRIIMGLDKNRRVPCGFCFVEFLSKRSAVWARRFLHKAVLDQRPLELDHEAKFTEGRQYGRGAKGGQKCDERRYWCDRERILLENKKDLRVLQEKTTKEVYGQPYLRTIYSPSRKRKR